MRWVLPLVVAVVLAVGTGDPPVVERARARPGGDRAAAGPGPSDGRSAASQCASFDPVTRRLTWFDDDDASYN